MLNCKNCQSKTNVTLEVQRHNIKDFLFVKIEKMLYVNQKIIQVTHKYTNLNHKDLYNIMTLYFLNIIILPLILFSVQATTDSRKVCLPNCISNHLNKSKLINTSLRLTRLIFIIVIRIP